MPARNMHKKMWVALDGQVWMPCLWELGLGRARRLAEIKKGTSISATILADVPQLVSC